MYLDELIVLFDKFPPDFKIHGKGKEDVTAMKAQYDSAVNGEREATMSLHFAQDTRKDVIRSVANFASHVLPAIEGYFGVGSVEANTAPRKEAPD
jgi:hypothetical protein